VLLVALNFLTDIVDDVADTDAQRLFRLPPGRLPPERWPQGRCPDEHPGLTECGL
jgi:nuclear transport factor 2 (NTF2) superfamily protein